MPGRLTDESAEAIKKEIYGYLLDLGLCDDRASEIIEKVTEFIRNEYGE